MEKNLNRNIYIYIYIYILNHFAIDLKLTQYSCKSTILQQQQQKKDV